MDADHVDGIDMRFPRPIQQKQALLVAGVISEEDEVEAIVEVGNEPLAGPHVGGEIINAFCLLNKRGNGERRRTWKMGGLSGRKQTPHWRASASVTVTFATTADAGAGSRETCSSTPVLVSIGTSSSSPANTAPTDPLPWLSSRIRLSVSSIDPLLPLPCGGNDDGGNCGDGGGVIRVFFLLTEASPSSAMAAPLRF